MKLTVLLLVLITLGFSQKTGAFGVTGGLNLNSLSVDGTAPDGATGFNFGAMYKASNNFVLSALYDTKGIDDSGIEATFSYLTIAAKYQMDFDKAFIAVGPAFGLELSATAEFGGVEVDLEDTESTRFSLVFGGGFNVNEKVSILASYDLGLTDSDDNSKSVWSSIQIGFGFWL